MQKTCNICHRKFADDMSGNRHTCRLCSIHQRKYPNQEKAFTYEEAKRNHHREMVRKIRHSKYSQNREFGGSGTKPVEQQDSGLTRALSLGTHMDHLAAGEQRIQCMVLFIPFDAGNNFYHQNAKKGTYTADLVPLSNGHFASPSNLDKEYTVTQLNDKPYPGQQAYEDLRPAGMAARTIQTKYNEIVDSQIKACNQVRAWKDLDRNSKLWITEVTKLVPEIIFLSEELKEAPFPTELRPCGQLTYKKIASIKEILYGTTVDAKNEIAAYVLQDPIHPPIFKYEKSVLTRKGTKDTHYEKWLCVQKIDPRDGTALKVAGVHLDSGYTNHLAQKGKESLTTVGKFGRENGVDALLGDLNMDTFELAGGFFPKDYSFIMLSDNIVKPVYTFSHSNVNSMRNYMGGMIINTDEVEIEPMGLTGQGALSTSRTLGGEYFSDHPALLANYVRSKKKR